jgi:hypothetical protein
MDISSKMTSNTQSGFVVLLFIIVIAVLSLVGGTALYMQQSSKVAETEKLVPKASGVTSNSTGNSGYSVRSIDSNSSSRTGNTHNSSLHYDLYKHETGAAVRDSSYTNIDNPKVNVRRAVTCNEIGRSTYCSDGTSYRQIGNAVYGSDGSNYRRIGNTVYGDDGSSYRRIGNTTYGDDGTSYRQIRNTIYGSDGSMYTQIGNTTYGYPGY